MKTFTESQIDRIRNDAFITANENPDLLIYLLNPSEYFENGIAAEPDFENLKSFYVFREFPDKAGRLYPTRDDPSLQVEINKSSNSITVNGNNFRCTIDDDEEIDNLKHIYCDRLDIRDYTQSYDSMSYLIGQHLQRSEIASKDFARFWQKVGILARHLGSSSEITTGNHLPTIVVPTEKAMSIGKVKLEKLKIFLNQDITIDNIDNIREILRYTYGETSKHSFEIYREEKTVKGKKQIVVQPPQFLSSNIESYHFEDTPNAEGTPTHIVSDSEDIRNRVVHIETTLIGEREWRFIYLTGVHVPKKGRDLM